MYTKNIISDADYESHLFRFFDKPIVNFHKSFIAMTWPGKKKQMLLCLEQKYPVNIYTLLFACISALKDNVTRLCDKLPTLVYWFLLLLVDLYNKLIDHKNKYYSNNYVGCNREIMEKSVTRVLPKKQGSIA